MPSGVTVAFFLACRSFQSSDLIGQHGVRHAADLGDDLKRVAFGLGGDWAADHQSGFAVVADRTDDQSRAMTRVNAPGLGSNSSQITSPTWGTNAHVTIKIPLDPLAGQS